MTESDWIYLLFSIVFSVCFVFNEFSSAGLSVDKIFGRSFGDEYAQFTQYHIKRTSVTLVIHSSLPLFFILLRFLSQGPDEGFLYQIIVSLAMFLPTLSITIFLYVYHNAWRDHPFVKNLEAYVQNNGNSSWKTVANDINIEYRSQDRMEIKMNSISSLIITENWIIKTLPYTIYVAHQSDTELIADKTDSHAVTEEGNDIIQYVNIRVKPQRSKEFSIRIKAPQFKSIQDRLRRQVIIMPNVRLLPSLIDRFIDAFKDQVATNPKYLYTGGELDTCFACFNFEPNIKIVKHCPDPPEGEEEEEDRCGNCYCRPMFCDSCMARWWFARQEKDKIPPEIFMERKSPCPMCRTRFCILDVCYIEKNGPVANQ